jgi:MFS family permease
MEWARTKKNRGFIAAWPQFGGPAGFFLANLAILAFSQLSGDQFLSWGWRVPFLLSIIMVGIGLYIRLGILETPIFQRVIAEERVARAPVVEVFKRQPKEIILTALARMGQMAPVFIYIAFIFPYGMQVVHLSRDFILLVLQIGSVFSFVTVLFSGWLSDRLGRKRVYMFGAAATGIIAFAYYTMLDTGEPALVIAAVLITTLFHDMMWGPLAALTAGSAQERVLIFALEDGAQAFRLRDLDGFCRRRPEHAAPWRHRPMTQRQHHHAFVSY